MQNGVLCYWERSSPLTSCLTSLTCTLVNNMAPTNVSSGLTNGLHLFYSPSSSWLYDGSGPRCKGIPLRDKLPEMAMLKGIVSLTQVLLFPLSQSYALASNFLIFSFPLVRRSCASQGKETYIQFSMDKFNVDMQVSYIWGVFYSIN